MQSSFVQEFSKTIIYEVMHLFRPEPNVYTLITHFARDLKLTLGVGS